jgi:type II secretion system protein G
MPTVKILRSGKEIGDYDINEIDALIKNETLKLTDHYWIKGMHQWQSVRNLLSENQIKKISVKEISEVGKVRESAVIILVLICTTALAGWYLINLSPKGEIEKNYEDSYQEARDLRHVYKEELVRSLEARLSGLPYVYKEEFNSSLETEDLIIKKDGRLHFLTIPTGPKGIAYLFVSESLKTSLVRYRIDMGDFPSTEEGIKALIVAPEGKTDKWRGPYMEAKGGNLPVDPWNEPYQYRYPGTHNTTGGYDLFSKGPDKIADTPDDIGNW